MKRGNRGTRALAPAALAAVLMVAGPARAQEADRQTAVAAQALYDQATAEMDAGELASACGKLEEVTRLVPDGLGAKMTLAQCYEAWGKLASAWAEFSRVEDLAAKAGQTERSTRAGEKVAELRPRLATLTIDVPEEVRGYPGLAITRDGVPLGQAQWGASVPVDTGEHEIAVTAPGRKPWREAAVVRADGESVSVAIPALGRDEPAALPEGPRAAPEAPAPPRRPPGARDVPPARGRAQRLAGLAVGGAGAVGIGVGAIFGLRALVKLGESNADGHCHDGNVCDEVGYGPREQAVRAGNVSTVLFIAGGAALVGGVALFLTAPDSAGPRANIGLGPRGITLEGGF
ncbi:hypothetical protein WME75_25355 [Sorangium sp. So ce1014]|uniref:hypothetical protein n=1 Tax=Sorangium sp. So ce1014 TaxID=3133326 RepID=UPI003F5EAD74